MISRSLAAQPILSQVGTRVSPSYQFKIPQAKYDLHVVFIF